MGPTTLKLEQSWKAMEFTLQNVQTESQWDKHYGNQNHYQRQWNQQCRNWDHQPSHNGRLPYDINVKRGAHNQFTVNIDLRCK
ncbi:hypothetical protein GDO86_012615 [Hymenochirus boettgeri]|uniref:Uncharacterized protein n=1 Tax=Hymenochirus boettgeri TaxID=247094 RepID=A0A8T2IT87_9PIPI|nr:hypothetical protein GDO86_012615 [Hymenochirus boettgeri]